MLAALAALAALDTLAADDVRSLPARAQLGRVRLLLAARNGSTRS